MALKATVHRAELEIADIDRGYYQSHALTLARHPSETEARLMVRLLAFVMHACDGLTFGRGISTDDEPDLWLRNDSGEIELWLDVGLPDERRLRRAAGRSRAVTVIAYGARAAEVWWRRHGPALTRLPTLAVWSVDDGHLEALGALASRNMSLQCTLQYGQIAISGSSYVVVEPRRLR